jgi:hypothetical protein
LTCMGMRSWVSAGAARGEKGLEKLGLSTLLMVGADFDDRLHGVLERLRHTRRRPGPVHSARLRRRKCGKYGHRHVARRVRWINPEGSRSGGTEPGRIRRVCCGE